MYLSKVKGSARGAYVKVCYVEYIRVCLVAQPELVLGLPDRVIHEIPLVPVGIFEFKVHFYS